MMVADVGMFLISLFLTMLVWSLTNRIRELELHDEAQWETIGRLWAEIRENRKRNTALEKDGDGNDRKAI